MIDKYIEKYKIAVEEYTEEREKAGNYIWKYANSDIENKRSCLVNE